MSLALLERQFATLYRLDAQGRLLCVNEAGNPPAPRVAIGRSPEGVICRTRADLPEQLAERIQAIVQHEPATAGLESEPRCRAALLELLAPVADEYRGPAFILANKRLDATGAVTIDAAHLDAIRPHFAWLLDEYRRFPVAAMLVGGVAVSVCFSSRVGADADEAGLETAAPFRGRGYALPAVAAWADIVRSHGRQPLYSTAWSNHASRAVARKLGGQCYGEDWAIW